ncbi:MAG: hypothetical protein ABIC18_03830 [Candidatus Omnitrophota bacterium]
MNIRTRINLGKIIKHWFITHPWFKLIALMLAILLWLYIGEELHRYLL